MDSDWLPYDRLRALLDEGNRAALLAYAAESPLRAVNDDGDFLVFVRDHDAWFIDGQGWQEANRPVGPIGGSCRQVINIIHGHGTWSKLPVPMSVRIHSVKWDGHAFVFSTSMGEIRSTEEQVWLAVNDSMTGRGLTEEEIEHNFRKLTGAVPLKWGMSYAKSRTASDRSDAR